MVRLEEGIRLCYGGRVLMEGVRPWVKADGAERTYLAFEKEEAGSYYFREGNKAMRLFFTEKEGAAALHMEVSCRDMDVDQAAGLEIAAVPCISGYMANYVRGQFWCDTRFGNSLQEIPPQTQALLGRADGGYLYLLTTCDKKYKSNLLGEQQGLTLLLYSCYPQDAFKACALIFAFSEDPYTLPAQTAEYGLALMDKPGKLREARRYPEVLEYLGWCSWDAFHMDVTEQDLLNKAAEFQEKEIPVRWMLLDDMWAHVPDIDRATMGQRKLYSFEADPVRFPGGLKRAITKLKEQYGMKVGMWHPTTGYWNGIDPAGTIAKEHRDLLAVSPYHGKLIPDPAFNKSFQFYYAFHRFLQACGADFVKVDNQSFILRHYHRLLPIGEAGINLHAALEASVGACFDGAIINCMCMANENFWNRPQSAVIRISDDFKPEDRKWFIRHLIQCSFNAYVQGSLYTGDWDMWWSDDAQGTKNAVLRAMSGGPVYVSDELGRSIKKTLLPIVYKDGRIIRLPEPARPAPACLLEEPAHSGKPYKVFNRAGDVGILAAFNLDAEEKPVQGGISPADVYGLPAGRYGLYDHFAGTLQMLEPGEEAPLTLQNYDDFRLYYLIPAGEGPVPVGLIDKYMAPATFTQIASGKALVHEGGKFAFMAQKAPRVKAEGKALAAKALGDLYVVDLPDQNDILLEWE